MTLFRYSCYNSISNWVAVHFYYTTFISGLLIIPILILYPEKLYMSAWPYRYQEQFNEGSGVTRIRRFLLFIILELVLISIYMFSALIFKFILNTGPISQVAFNCWIIEAFYGRGDH